MWSFLQTLFPDRISINVHPLLPIDSDFNVMFSILILDVNVMFSILILDVNVMS